MKLFDIETRYTKLTELFIETINDEYEKLFIEALRIKENELSNRVANERYNALNFQDLIKRLDKTRKNIIDGVLFNKMFTSIYNIFKRVDLDIIGNIRTQYKKHKFPVPELQLKEPSALISSYIENNIKMVTSISTEHINDLEKMVKNIVVSGGDTEEQIKEFAKVRKLSVNRVRFATKDQVAKAYSEINEQRQKNSGFPGFIWNGHRDSRIRPTHKELNGKFFRWDKLPVVLWSDGVMRETKPGLEPGCRCGAIPSFG